MQLEDHIGDILRKAQILFGPETKRLIEVSSLANPAWNELIQTGHVTAGNISDIHWKTLGKTLGIDGQRLEAIANGWTPAAIDLSQWKGFIWLQSSGKTEFNEEALLNTVNTYIVYSEKEKTAILFDPGWDATQAIQFLQSKGLNLIHIYLTHQHPDHVAALPILQQTFRDVIISDRKSYDNCDHASRSMESFSEKITIQALFAPGHSKDSILYVINGLENNQTAQPNRDIAIIGDTLFSGSIGYPFYNKQALKTNVREQLCKKLAPETLLGPGHGPITDLQTELAHNPFLSHPELRPF